MGWRARALARSRDRPSTLSARRSMCVRCAIRCSSRGRDRVYGPQKGDAGDPASSRRALRGMRTWSKHSSAATCAACRVPGRRRPRAGLIAFLDRALSRSLVLYAVVSTSARRSGSVITARVNRGQALRQAHPRGHRCRQTARCPRARGRGDDRPARGDARGGASSDETSGASDAIARQRCVIHSASLSAAERLIRARAAARGSR